MRPFHTKVHCAADGIVKVQLFSRPAPARPHHSPSPPDVDNAFKLTPRQRTPVGNTLRIELALPRESRL